MQEAYLPPRSKYTLCTVLSGDTPFPGQGWGYSFPGQGRSGQVRDRGDYPLPRSGWGGTPHPYLEMGTPFQDWGEGVTHFPSQGEGVPLPDLGRGVPPSHIRGGGGYPLPQSGWGVPLPDLGKATPPCWQMRSPSPIGKDGGTPPRPTKVKQTHACENMHPSMWAVKTT